MGTTRRGAIGRCESAVVRSSHDQRAHRQSGNARLDKIKRKFTSFIKSAVVEFDQREAPTYPEGNIVEVCPLLQATLCGDKAERYSGTHNP
jgi:hypothetical protein